jgi:hypothetical protein
VRTEPAADIGPGVFRVTAMRRKPNLRDLCESSNVSRRVVAFQLEDACRFGGLVPGDRQASLKPGRSVFQHALMLGQPPDLLPATDVASARALDEASFAQLAARFAGAADQAPTPAAEGTSAPKQSRGPGPSPRRPHPRNPSRWPAAEALRPRGLIAQPRPEREVTRGYEIIKRQF